MTSDTSTTSSTTDTSDTLTPDESGYADVNGLQLYWESYGQGTPLVLLHGGLLTIDLNFASLIPTLAQRFRVIGVEQQGHGRTADIDRPITYPALASDVVALLDHLGLAKAILLGHSMGGGAVMEVLVSRPDRVLAAVPISVTVRKEGMHPDLSDPSTFGTSTIMPTAQDFTDMTEAYARLSPHPEHFQDFMGRLGAMDTDFEGWTDEQLAGIDCPVLLVIGDHDFTLAEHGAFMQQRIPGSELAVLPGTTHMQATRDDTVLLPILTRFFDRHGL